MAYFYLLGIGAMQHINFHQNSVLSSVSMSKFKQRSEKLACTALTFSSINLLLKCMVQSMAFYTQTQRSGLAPELCHLHAVRQ